MFQRASWQRYVNKNVVARRRVLLFTFYLEKNPVDARKKVIFSSCASRQVLLTKKTELVSPTYTVNQQLRLKRKKVVLCMHCTYR